MGFCTFNGLMLAAVKLKREYRLGDIGIIDFDMHWGNGTVDIINELKIEYIEHMAFNDQVGNDYNDWLNQLEDNLKEKLKAVTYCFIKPEQILTLMIHLVAN